MEKKIKAFIHQWSNYRFSSGTMTGDDYLKFQNGFRRVLAGIATQAGYQIHQFNKNHYCCSAVLMQIDTGAFAYLSISDVRFWPNQWYTNLLYRQMRHQKDWTGRENHYCTLEELAGELSRLIAALNQMGYGVKLYPDHSADVTIQSLISWDIPNDALEKAYEEALNRMEALSGGAQVCSSSWNAGHCSTDWDWLMAKADQELIKGA